MAKYRYWPILLYKIVCICKVISEAVLFTVIKEKAKI